MKCFYKIDSASSFCIFQKCISKKCFSLLYILSIYFPININKSLLTQTRLNINQNCTISFHLILSSFLVTSNLFVTFSSCTYLRYPDLIVKAFGSSTISFPRAFLFHDTLSHGTRIYRIYIYT